MGSLFKRIIIGLFAFMALISEHVNALSITVNNTSNSVGTCTVKLYSRSAYNQGYVRLGSIYAGGAYFASGGALRSSTSISDSDIATCLGVSASNVNLIMQDGANGTYSSDDYIGFRFSYSGQIYEYALSGATGTVVVAGLVGTLPTINSITRQTPSSSPTDADSVTWRVTFSEAVQNVDAADFTVSDSTASLSVSSISSSVYDVTASGGDLANLNATITLGIQTTANGQNIIGLTSNALGNDSTTGTFIISNDSTSPTMTITAAGGADGFTSDDSTLSLTFSASESTNNFDKEDITVTNAALGALSGSGTTYTITLTPSSIGAVTVDVAAGTFTDAAGNNNLAATQFNWTYGVDPTAKAGVKGTVEATANSAVRFGQASMKNIGWRFDWLRRNHNSANKSVQGANIAFADPLLQQYFNGDPKALDAFNLASAKDVLQRVGTNPDSVMTDVQAAPMELAMAEAKEAFGKADLNPTGGTVYGDWSVWTAGQVTIGDIQAKDASVATESESYTLAIGIDKPTGANSLIGYALNVGKDDSDIGTDGTYVKSDNYNLSVYSSFETSNELPIELAMGVGRMDMRMQRIDGSQTLSGDRTADMVFGTAKIRKATVTVDNISVSPYAKLEAAYIRLNQYTETGGTLALHYDKQNVRRALTSVGVDVDWVLKMDAGTLYPFANLQYSLDLSDKTDADMNYVGGSTIYSIALKRAAERYWGAGLGLDYIHKVSGMSSMIMYQRDEAVGVGHSDSIQIKFSMPF